MLYKETDFFLFFPGSENLMGLLIENVFLLSSPSPPSLDLLLKKFLMLLILLLFDRLNSELFPNEFGLSEKALSLLLFFKREKFFWKPLKRLRFEDLCLDFVSVGSANVDRDMLSSFVMLCVSGSLLTLLKWPLCKSFKCFSVWDLFGGFLRVL